jgi:hypothetical protein
MVDKSTLDQCLKDISLPASRDEIVECVAGNNCRRDAILELKNLRAGTFRSEDALLCELGDPRYCS